MGLLSLFGFGSDAKLFPKKIIVSDQDSVDISLPLYEKLKKGLYEDAEKFLKQLNNDKCVDVINSFSDKLDSNTLVNDWVDNCPKSALAYSVLGYCLISAGWRVRGNGYANSLGKKQIQEFAELIFEAEDSFNLALELDKKSILPYPGLITATFSIGGDNKEKIEFYYNSSKALDPHSYATPSRYFLTKTAKWGGSHEEMFEFAENASKNAPIGSEFHQFLARAYCELALAEDKSYYHKIRNENNSKKISTALYSYLGATRENLDQKINLKKESVNGLNYFAVACYLCGADYEAKVVIDSLDFKIRTVPWAWITRNISENLYLDLVFKRVYKSIVKNLGKSENQR